MPPTPKSKQNLVNIGAVLLAILGLLALLGIVKLPKFWQGQQPTMTLSPAEAAPLVTVAQNATATGRFSSEQLITRGRKEHTYGEVFLISSPTPEQYIQVFEGVLPDQDYNAWRMIQMLEAKQLLINEKHRLPRIDVPIERFTANAAGFSGSETGGYYLIFAP